MQALLQSVLSAEVKVEERLVSRIDQGLLVYLGIEKADSHQEAARLAERTLRYRMFVDEAGKMGLDVQQIQGEILVVSQFTLAANTQKGHRPSFSEVAPVELASELYHYYLDELDRSSVPIKSGEFRSNMQISSINNGPITFLLRI